MDDSLRVHVPQRVDDLGGIVAHAAYGERAEPRYSRLELAVAREVEDEDWHTRIQSGPPISPNGA